MTEERIRKSVDAYVTAWNETDATTRGALLREACSDQFVLVTSGRRAEGREGLDAMIADFQKRLPESVVTITSGIDVQGSQLVRFAGVVRGPRLPTPAVNMDAGEVDADGRFVRLLTFIGETLPAKP